MDPLIREFPSKQFYNGIIKDDPSISQRQVQDGSGSVSRLCFYNLEYTKCQGGISKFNEKEAEFVTQLFMESTLLRGKMNFEAGLKEIEGKVGIITPYKQQFSLIREYITKAIKKKRVEIRKESELIEEEKSTNVDINKIVQVSTVDSFQGREKEIIIISLVRVS